VPRLDFVARNGPSCPRINSDLHNFQTG
jgi:hypothetical protein